MVYFDRKTKTQENIKDNKSLIFLYNTVLGRIILKVITCRIFSKLFGFLTNLKISKIYIKSFIRKNNIDMSLYEDVKYKNFNDFFTRKLKVSFGKSKSSDLICLCDSKLMVYKIDDKLTFNVKSSKYTVNSLIGEPVSSMYKGGLCLVFRLCPDDYHRYHAVDDYKVINHKIINGKLHTVNPISYDRYKVFSENQREVSLLRTKHFGDVYQIEVGALNIGKIHNNNKVKYKRYDEKGYFSFGGSTIILLFQKDAIKLDKDILSNSKLNIETKVSYMEVIGKVK